MEAKRRKRSSVYYGGRDRLSEMLDEILIHILSSMPTIDAVRTMLIRRFGNLWTLVHTLHFEVPEVLDKFHLHLFNIFVRNMLMRHKRPVIDKFHLLLGRCYQNGRQEAVDNTRMWLKFALDKQSKEIYFCDIGFDWGNSSDFPNFTSESLVTLELCNCYILPEFQVKLESLKKLIISETDMCEETFQKLICGCPSLQELRIVEPKINKLRFTAPNIRKLSLVFIDEHSFDDPWSFDFPNLKSLDLETRHIPHVIDVSSIQDVYVKWFDSVTDEDEIRILNLFLEKFSCCEAFHLSLNASEPFLHAIANVRLLQIRWKRVVLRLRVFCQSCFLGIYQLIRISKDLEELDIYTDTTLTYRSVCNTPQVMWSGI